MRERGVEVFLLRDLLAEALAASDEAGNGSSSSRCPSTRSGCRSSTRSGSVSGLKPDELATAPDRRPDGRRGRARPRRSSEGRRCRRRARRHERVRAPAAAEHPVHPRLVLLDLRRGVRSTRCTGRLGGSRHTTSRRSTGHTRCSRTPTSSTGTRPSATTDGSTVQDFGRSSMEGGDVQPIGNGTVLIGLSERTQARMIEQIARALFDKGAAERVIAVVMTKDRAHMHLDTVFTMLDRDKVTAYPQVINNVRAISLRPGSKSGEFHVTEEESFLRCGRRCPGGRPAAGRRDRRRRVPAGARAVGRRQQRRRARAGRRRRLRAQHLHDRRRCARPASRSSRSRASSWARAAAAGTA